MGVAVARDETNGTRPTLLGFRPTPEALSHKCNAAQEWRRRKAWHPTRFRVGRYGEVSEEASRLSLEGQGRRAGPGRGGAGGDPNPNPIAGREEATGGGRGGGMTRGKQKIDAQRRNAERNQKSKGSQLEARAVGLKVVCPICKVQLANEKQLIDHYGSKHPKEKPPSTSTTE
ncbi:uncharacterized protein LOC8072441 [Sorghum bicolor]|nr:uncharacterized protein LOC8072441 [Sorghum bicolor]|eukprot:XP_002452424.2 uncharacterized protein LOC8072441 [Sorghum bicolor]